MYFNNTNKKIILQQGGSENNVISTHWAHYKSKTVTNENSDTLFIVKIYI